MIIKSLLLHNFGVYAGDNIFSFSSKRKSKKVTLIGGMNGRGKTTFLEAVLLALYGANSFSVSESSYKTYGEYLRAHINIADETLESFVTLEFDMNEENDNNTYIITRVWNGNSSRIHDKIVVYKNGMEDKFLTQNWTMFIESILPSALANFFFFDGEKIAELAEGETSPQMKNSIKTLLGINVLDILDLDLGRIQKKLHDENVEGYNAAHLDELRDIKETKQALLDEINNEITKINKNLENTENNLKKKREEFEAKGGNIADQSRALLSERGNLGGKAEQLRSEFVEMASAELPLVLVKSMISEIAAQAAKERESYTMQTAVSKIEDLYSQYNQNNKSAKNAISEFVGFIKSETDKAKVDMIYDLSESGYFQANMLKSSLLDSSADSYKKAKITLDNIEKRLNEIDNYLAIDIDEKAIQRIYKKICELENKKIEFQVQLDNKNKERVSINGDCIRATSEFNRCVEHSLKVIEREDDKVRLGQYALMAQTAVQKYKIELQKSKVDELARTMTERCTTLFGKRNFIYKVHMDFETLDYTFIDKSGNEIPKSSLSAGEKQLMVISMLWALAICSRKKLPVIIDTPLARLDSKHRKALIKKYFPKASEQTIVLSTDSEIDTVCYEELKSCIGNEFTLIYNDETKCSTIEEGYFKGVIQ
ncbi:MAG: DNA sulfur modification protein DndD [Ruminococcus sp.]|nr:DNA sulfur modification protein DndD [Ruminococcus sp.]